MIELFKVYMHPDAWKDVKRVLESGYIGEGSLVQAFESAIGEMIENPNVVMVNSGTSALVLALRQLAPGGTHVISTPITCLATNMAIEEAGYRVVWADVDPRTGLIDPESVDYVLSNSRDIAAIMCMDWGGDPCNLAALTMFPYPLIEDACQALGSTHGAKPVGCGVDAAAFSFQAIKTLTCGDGGAVAFLQESDAKEARLKRWFGLDRTKSNDMRCGQDPPFNGFKMQMNNISAAIGLANLKSFEQNIEKATRNFNVIRNVVYDKDGMQIVEAANGTSCHWLCTLLMDNVPEFISFMRNRGIMCSKVHARNDTKKVFDYAKRDLPGVEEFDRRHVCVPCGWWLTKDDLNDVVNAIKDYKNG